MDSQKKQGIIYYSEPEDLNNDNLIYPTTTNDGTLIYYGDVEPSIDTDKLNIDNFTISYHGLVEEMDLNASTYYPRRLAHIALMSEELDSDFSDKLLQGEYIKKRSEADSLLSYFNSANEHSIGYAIMTSYSKKIDDHAQLTHESASLKVARGIGDLAVRSILVAYIEQEISREKGQFLMEGTMTPEDIDSVLSSPDFSTAYAIDDNGVQSVVILADSPSALPWFNEDRIEKLAEKMGQQYDDVKLAFLALTNPSLRSNRLAPALFNLAFSQLEGVGNNFILCTECSPRSISYTPYLMTRQLSGAWQRRQTVTERTRAVIYPITKS